MFWSSAHRDMNYGDKKLFLFPNMFKSHFKYSGYMAVCKRIINDLTLSPEFHQIGKSK